MPASQCGAQQNCELGNGRLTGGRELPRSVFAPSPPLNSSGEIRHGHLLSRSLSAGWSAFKAAQKSTWAALWVTCQLRAVASSSPGPSFCRLHSSLSRRQSTLLTRLRTGASYKAHFEPERLLCACSGEPETCNHFFLHYPLYTMG